jgi:hypothetical protein
LAFQRFHIVQAVFFLWKADRTLRSRYFKNTSWEQDQGSNSLIMEYVLFFGKRGIAKVLQGFLTHRPPRHLGQQFARMGSA